MPSYEQMHREADRPGSAIYYLNHNQADPLNSQLYTQQHPIPYALPTGTVNMSNYKVNFNYQGSDLPARQAASTVQAAAPPALIKVKSTSFLPHQYSFNEASASNNESVVRGLTSTSSLKELLSNNKLVYSDSSTTY